ncbi:LacI family DNA-binding transcriptional regulator [Streptomyces sp. NPDC058221]|uniref:LacI family DNA-binding transcriptional regulator n=1 Tax=Streptomyces sp. NPDC058221 TaxID=3346388 RepID=UPI0036E71B7A
MPKPRLADVAALAGVSMKTVSNVVRGHPPVRPATRERVEAAVKELGYRPHSAARRLASGRTGMLSLAMPLIGRPYFAELANKFSEAAAERDYRLLIQQTIAGPQAERDAIDVSETGLVDGILFQPVTLSAAEISRIGGRNHPLVLLGEQEAPPECDRVMIDNVAAAAEAVQVIADLGRRRIAFLGVEPEPLTAATVDRMAGYRAGMRNAGLPVAEERLLPLDGLDTPDGERAVRRAIEEGVRFDGLVCRDDGLAIGALRALRAAGASVPGDVAVVGWDGDAIGAFLETSLTTVSPDMDAIVEKALGFLIERIEGFAGPGRHVIAPHAIVIRESAPAT